MRKLLLSLSAAALAISGVVPATANPEAGASQIAFATWVTKGTRQRVFYGAIGIRDVHSGGTQTLGTVFRGTCRKHVHKGETSIICRAGGVLTDVDPEQFEFHPLLESASLEIKTDSHTHRVAWTGGPAPQATGGVAHEERSYFVDAGLVRGASAKGRVFGKRVAHKAPLDLAVLAEWGSVFTTGPGDGLDVDIDADGRFRVTRRVRLD